MIRHLKRIFISYGFLAFALILAVVAGSVAEPEALLQPERTVYDHLLRLRSAEGEPKVVLVAIDGKSLDRLGMWPWPRTRLADLVRSAVDSGASAVGLDLYLQGVENNPGLEMLRGLQQEWAGRDEESEILPRLESAVRELDGDAHLSRAMESGRVVLPLRVTVSSSQIPSDLSPMVERYCLPLKTWSVPFEDYLKRLRNPWPAWRPGPLRVGEMELPEKQILQHTAGAGHGSISPDSDGTVRSLPLLVSSARHSLPAFPLAVALAAGDLPPSTLQIHGPLEDFTGLQWTGRRVPTDERFRMLIDFAAARESLLQVSASDLLEGTVPEGLLRGKIVLIGLTDPEEALPYRTPFGSSFSGVEIAASAVVNLTGSSFVYRPLWAFPLETGLLIYFSVFLLFVLPRVNLRSAFLIMGIFTLTWYGVAGVLLVQEGWWLKVVPISVLSAGGLFLLMARSRSASGRRDESGELNRMLGLTFQGQGMLDLAYEKFLRCPVEDPSVKELLYNLGLDFERKRMHNKAAAVYRHIQKAGSFRDIGKRISRLESTEKTVMLGGGATGIPLLSEGGIPPTLGRYEIVSILGQGAMGTVYLGKDPRIQREVAIKTLQLSEMDGSQGEEVKKRFFREAEAAGRLSHPRIVTIYDAGEDGDVAYLAMEILTGGDLSGYCSPGSLLPVGRVLDVVEAVAEALDYAHRHEVVHRDIKPSNIMLTGDGEVKVTDFGIARILNASHTRTGTGTILGTPHYMSPEQVSGKRVDGRSDLFSLGTVAYELLAGCRAFQGESLPALMYSITQAKHLPLQKAAAGVPRCCAELVEKLLARGVTRRFRKAAEVVEAVRRCREAL